MASSTLEEVQVLVEGQVGLVADAHEAGEAGAARRRGLLGEGEAQVAAGGDEAQGALREGHDARQVQVGGSAEHVHAVRAHEARGTGAGGEHQLPLQILAGPARLGEARGVDDHEGHAAPRPGPGRPPGTRSAGRTTRATSSGTLDVVERGEEGPAQERAPARVHRVDGAPSNPAREGCAAGCARTCPGSSEAPMTATPRGSKRGARGCRGIPIRGAKCASLYHHEVGAPICLMEGIIL